MELVYTLVTNYTVAIVMNLVMELNYKLGVNFHL